MRRHLGEDCFQEGCEAFSVRGKFRCFTSAFLSSSPFPRSIESSSLRFPRRILEEEWKWRLIGHDSELSILDLNNNKQ